MPRNPGATLAASLRRRRAKAAKLLSDTSRDLMEKGRDLYAKGLRVADEAADMIERGRKLVEG